MSNEGAQPVASRSPKKSLGQRTASGVMWMTLQGFGVKGATTLSTFILMAVLLKEEWGIFALAMSLRALLDVTSRIGMRQVLVHRHKHFRRWATPAFWMCMSISGIASLLLVGAAPLMAAAYNQPDLFWLLVILASSSPFIASGMVPHAKLMSQMRFKAIASVELITHLATIFATVILALYGFKAYSFFIPLPFMEIGRSASFWYLSRPKISLKPQLRRWKFLFGDTSSLFVTNILNRVISQSDYLILGLFQPTAIVGIYAVASRLSVQSMRLLAANLTQAMLPALSKLQTDNQRQVRAFVRAGTLLCALYTPLGLMQAAVCEPVLRLIYVSKWEQAIPVLQILSVFMVLRILNGPAISLIRAQGRFKIEMILQIVNSTVFVVLVFFVSAIWSIKACALTVGLISLIFVPLRVFIGIRPAGGTLRDVIEIYRKPLIAGLLAYGVAYSTRWLIPTTLPNDIRYIAEIMIIGLLGTGLYAAILRWCMPTLWHDLLQQLKNVNPLKRTKRKKTSVINAAPDSSFSN